MLVVTLISMAASALVLMLVFPDTPTARWLHRILVEAPARFFMEFTWAKLGSVLISLVVVMFLVSAGPETVVLLTAAGVDAAMLEVMLAIWLVSVSGNIAEACRTIARVTIKSARWVGTVLAPRNRPRAQRRKIRLPRRKDDQAEPGWAFA